MDPVDRNPISIFCWNLNSSYFWSVFSFPSESSNLQICWATYRYFEQLTDMLSNLQIFWATCRYFEHLTDMLSNLQIFWATWRYFEQLTDILSNLQIFWATYRYFEQLADILSNLQSLLISARNPITQLCFFPPVGSPPTNGCSVSARLIRFKRIKKRRKRKKKTRGKKEREKERKFLSFGYKWLLCICPTHYIQEKKREKKRKNLPPPDTNGCSVSARLIRFKRKK